MTDTVPTPQDRARLDRFVNARIGGETIEDEAQSDLVIRTVSDAAAAMGSLVNSANSGLGGPNPWTKTVNGAGKTVHLLTGGMSASESSALRGLTVFVLALGGALIGVDLLTDDTPAWITVAGFAILLGGLAVAALRTRQPILALTLATAVVPLLVWSVSGPGSKGEPLWTRFVEMAGVAGVIGTLMVIGYVREPTWAEPVPPALVPAAAQARRRRRGQSLRVIVLLVGLVLVVLLVTVLSPKWAAALMASSLSPILAGVLAAVLLVLILAGWLRALPRLRACAASSRNPQRDTIGKARTAPVLLGYGTVYAILAAALGALAWSRLVESPGAVESDLVVLRLVPVVTTLLLLAAACLVIPLRWGSRAGR